MSNQRAINPMRTQSLGSWIWLGSCGSVLMLCALMLPTGCKEDAQQQQQQQQQAGCASDRDCKGDRICVKGACEDPPTAVHPPVATKPQVREGVFARRKLSFYRSKFAAWQEQHADTCPKDLAELIGGESKPELYQDPWGRSYLLKCGDNAPEGQSIGVLSLGPDGLEGTDDDLGTW